ncbi:MAG: HAD-IB family hydrolase [Alphaproteobacteria bacterium]|nr:HAD-IB family hydrolase [Alphaproteobacteria bacterium]
MSAAYFDVDGTLVGTNLLHPTVMYLLSQATPQESVRRFGAALLQGPRMALAERADRRLFNELLFSHYKGMSEDRLVVLADDVFEAVVKPRIFRGARDIVAKCQDAGLRVVLITGSLDYTIGPLCDHLGVPRSDMITNRLEMKDRSATGKLMRPVVAGPEKARLIVADALAHGHDLATSQAYSDSYSDVPMLSVVGHPFCVNPDRRLARLATAYDWPILDIDRPARGMATRSG